jgi:dTMP kinase
MSFIVIEGCDRFGKSTQTRMLLELFLRCGLRATMFSFPNYDSPTGKIIQEHLYNKVFLAKYDRSRSQYDALVFQCVQSCDKYAVASQILADLKDGQIVVCGRWWQSAFVYGLDDGLDPLWLKDVHACMPMADVNILLDFDPDEAARRVPEGGDRFDRDLLKQRRLRDSYLHLWQDYAKIQGSQRWPMVSADGTPEEVHKRIVDCIKKHLTFTYGSLPRTIEG